MAFAVSAMLIPTLMAVVAGLGFAIGLETESTIKILLSIIPSMLILAAVASEITGQFLLLHVFSPVLDTEKIEINRKQSPLLFHTIQLILIVFCYYIIATIVKSDFSQIL